MTEKKPLYKEYKMKVCYTLKQSTCKKISEIYIKAYQTGNRVTMSSIIDDAIALYYIGEKEKFKDGI